ncbi:MAG TPA: hypothetical protein VEI83_04030 [Acidimicrobiales bacterium]|nr:hypothetical protein [Acidimicrobiales bacterium]
MPAPDFEHCPVCNSLASWTMCPADLCNRTDDHAHWVCNNEACLEEFTTAVS